MPTSVSFKNQTRIGNWLAQILVHDVPWARHITRCGARKQVQ